MCGSARANWFWIAVLLIAVGIIAAVTVAVLGETAQVLRTTLIAPVVSSGQVDIGRRLWTCVGVTECRALLVWALGRSIRAHGPIIRVTYGLLVFCLVCMVLFRSRMPLARSAAGRARYALRTELRRLRIPTDEAWLPLGYLPPSRLVRSLLRFPFGRRAFRTLAGPQVCLPAEDLARHVLVVGLTGAHKTTAVTFPVLLEAARHGVSVVALDLKYGEADSLARAAPEWQRWGRDVLIFAPLESATLRWNPFDRCRTIGDAYQLSAHLFEEPDPSDPDLVYWLGAERHVCAVLCFALATDAGPATLGRLRSLCESGPAAIQSFLKAHRAASTLVSRLGAFLAMLPKDQAGILQGIASKLEAWGDEGVCAATGSASPWESIDLNRVRREPLLLLVGVPQAALGRLRWLCHLFLRDLAASLLCPRDSAERVRVLLILEELPAWGALPELADHLATYRSRHVSVLATLQSEAQGEQVYGRNGWAAVAANLVTKLYLPLLADADAERLSRVMGTAAGEDVAQIRGWGPSGTRKGEQRRTIPVPLERPEMLRGVDVSPEEILVRFPRIPPARLWCPPYYLRPEYSDRIPSEDIRTADLAVYHHLRTIRAKGVTSAVDVAPPPETGLPAAAPTSPPQPDRDVQTDAEQRKLRIGIVPVALASDDDVAALNRIVETLVVRVQHDAGTIVRAVCSGGRIAELRVHPEAVARLCRGPDAMHALARRWSALRWVRRVRPTFVLGKRAMDALDPFLLQKLNELCGREPTPTSSPSDPRRC